eukprot:3718143-Alexandrium_andersonii.AAC.1
MADLSQMLTEASVDSATGLTTLASLLSAFSKMPLPDECAAKLGACFNAILGKLEAECAKSTCSRAEAKPILAVVDALAGVP